MAVGADAVPLLPRKRGVLQRRQTVVAWGFALPFLILFVVFHAGPVLASLGMSVTDMQSRDLRNPFAVNFIGFSNFIAIFANDQFRAALRNTIVFTVVGVPLTVLLGLLVAVALDKGISRFRTVFRVGFYAPVVTSIVAIAVVWRFILQPDGLLNTVLGWAHIHGPNWLQDPTWALPAIIAMAVWRNVGTLMVIFLAGLQAVPVDIQEAAMVDGANSFQRFTKIVFPVLRPAVLFGAVITGISFLQFFEEPFVMTQGGPLDSTLSMAYYTYNQFSFGRYGYASAASYVMFALVVLLTFIQFRLLREKK